MQWLKDYKSKKIYRQIKICQKIVKKFVKKIRLKYFSKNSSKNSSKIIVKNFVKKICQKIRQNIRHRYTVRIRTIGQGQLQIWTEHSTLTFENLKPVEISKNHFNII